MGQGLAKLWWHVFGVRNPKKTTHRHHINNPHPWPIPKAKTKTLILTRTEEEALPYYLLETSRLRPRTKPPTIIRDPVGHYLAVQCKIQGRDNLYRRARRQ